MAKDAMAVFKSFILDANLCNPLIWVCITLCACGGGGGGGGGADPIPITPSPPAPTTPQIYPKLQPDSRDFGVEVGYDSGKFNLTDPFGAKYILTPTRQSGNHYTINPMVDGSNTLYATALLNADVLTIAAVRANEQPDPTLFFGVSGNFYEPKITGGHYFTGNYVALSTQGQVIGNWPMEVVFDADNLARSYGADLIDGQDIQIKFSDYTDDALHGTISDPTHDYHNAAFNFYGNGGRTMAGGYADGFGVGILLVTR